VRLPPCIEALLSITEDEKARKLIVGFIREYQPRYNDVAEIVGTDVANELFEEAKDTTATFSCIQVTERFPGACDITNCPLVSTDPVSLLLNFADKIIYNRATKELKIYFAGKDEPLIIPVKAIATDRRSVLGDISAFTLEMFNTPIVLRTFTKEDTGERIDQLQQFITRAFARAIHVREDDIGIGELLTELYNLYPPVEKPTTLPDAFIYADRHGKYYAVLAKHVRQKARSLLGITSIRKLTQLLRRFGIEKRRIMVSRQRAYYYLVPFSVFRELLGSDPTPVSAEFDEAIASLDDIYKNIKDWGDDE